MLCNVWLAESSRAPALWRHDHNIGDQNMAVLLIVRVDLPCLRKKICHQNDMLMTWKVGKFKDEDLKILGRQDSSWNSAPFFLKTSGPLNCTFTLLLELLLFSHWCFCYCYIETVRFYSLGGEIISSVSEAKYLVTQAGAPLHSHWLATCRVTGHRPRCFHWKSLRFWDTLTFKQLRRCKIFMNATNSPDRLNLYIFSLSLSYHSFVSVHDIQQNRLLNKISVYAFTHRGGQHLVANATLFVACTRDGCATFRSPVTSSEVTWITWSPLWRSTRLPNSEIFIARNNAFFIVTAHVVKDVVAKILG